MNKLAVCFIASILLACMILTPNVVYADDGFSFPISTIERWPDSVVGRDITKFDAPPQLDVIQAFRWRQASPSAKPHLAKIYGVSPDVAELYGAKYIKYIMIWEIWD